MISERPALLERTSTWCEGDARSWSGTPVETTPERWNSLRGASPWWVYGALTNSSPGDAWLSRFSE